MRLETRQDGRSGRLAEPPSPFGLTIESVAGLRSMRQQLASWLLMSNVESRLSVGDVQLATVEIVTNAFLHSAATSVAVALRVGDQLVTVSIDHEPVVEPEGDFVGRPSDVESIGGRGLFVVDQIVTSRTVTRSGTHWTTWLEFELT